MRYTWVAIAILAVLATGCTSLRTSLRISSSVADEGAGQASPGQDLVGTWRGMVFAASGSNYAISTPVDLSIYPDGTWSWSKRGAQQARGHVVRHGDRVVLKEDISSKEGDNTIVLKERGGELWGVSEAFVPFGMNAVQLEKVQS